MQKWAVVIKNIKKNLNGDLNLSENININLSSKNFKYVVVNSKNIAHIKTVLTTDLENYSLNNDDANWKERNSTSYLSNSKKPVLFIALYSFVDSAKTDTSESISPVLGLAYFNPKEKELAIRNETYFINTSGMKIDESEVAEIE